MRDAGSGVGNRLGASSAYLLVFAFACAAPLHAQVIRATVLDSALEAPIVGGILSLEATVGARVSPVLTDDEGRAQLVAPSPGRYRVRLDRVGMTTWRSPIIELASGTAAARTFRVPVRVAGIGTVVVTADASCEQSPREGSAAAALWYEAQTAVLSAELARTQRPPTLRIERFERLLDPYGRVQHRRRDTVFASTTRPFVTALPAERLAEHGYVIQQSDGDLFLAPDAEVLLSDDFARHHCFRVVGNPRETELIGLAFEPAEGRDVPEIAGTFWLDRATSELRRIDFGYVNAGDLAREAKAGDLAREAKAGGRVAFKRAPAGQWFVSDWEVRTHRPGVVRWRMGLLGSERDTLYGTKVEGATATIMSSAPVGAGTMVTLYGTAYDSARMEPLAGVRVGVVGTPATAMTDADGAYSLSFMASGEHTVTFDHSQLALYRITPNVHVADPGATHRLDLGIPSPHVLRARLCPAAEARSDDYMTTVVGSMRSATGGRPVPFARIRAMWRVLETRMVAGGYERREVPVFVDATADDRGNFVLCDVPGSRPVELIAQAAGFRVKEQGARLRDVPVQERVIELEPCRAGDDAEECPEP